MGVFKKKGNWWIDFRYRGNRIRKRVGPSKKVAEIALADAQVKIAKKEFLGIVEPKRILLSDFVAEYLEYSRANKAEMTYIRDRLTLEVHVLAFWRDKYLDQIKPKMIEDFKKFRLRKVTPQTLNRDLGVLKTFFKKGVEWEYLRENPAAGIKLLKEPRGLPRFLSTEEIHLLLEFCSRYQNPLLYPVVVLALNTGMRRREIFNLRWEDIDWGQ